MQRGDYARDGGFYARSSWEKIGLWSSVMGDLTCGYAPRDVGFKMSRPHRDLSLR